MGRGRRESIVEEDAHGQRARAWEDVGATVSDRLSWVVDFIRSDLSRLTPAARMAYGYALRVLANSYPGTDADTRPDLDTYTGPMADRLILRLQREVHAGIRRLLTPNSAPSRPFRTRAAIMRFGQHVARTTQWSLPREHHRVLMRVPMSRGGPRDFIYVEASRPVDERTAVIAAIVHLITQSGNQLRACAECRQPFVGIKRQEYCSPACSQILRNRRKQKGAQ